MLRCGRGSTLHRAISRTLVSSAIQRQDIKAVSTTDYEAPLKKTVRNIKIFSISSLVVSTLISPVFFIIESQVDNSVRAAMIGIALGTSGLSTAVIQWVLKPYCISGKILSETGFTMDRLTWFGRRRTTIVDARNLKIDKNGRMFANLTTEDGKDHYYVHEQTHFWRQLVKNIQSQKDIARPLDGST